MTEQEIWDCEAPVAGLLDCDVPAWIGQDISAADIAAICQGGCASGAYMPAVTYYQAVKTMSEHGDDVLPAVPSDTSWSGLALFFLSCAVELWAGGIMAGLENLDIEESE
jgi:hypothetical protein